MIMEHGRALAIGSPAELARTVVASRIVEVELAAEQRNLAVEALRDADFEDVTAGPDGLTLRVEARDAIPTVVAVLAQAEVSIYRVAEHEPDLEAAYFALHGRSADGSPVK
jgi:ABC-2 type transport system ATP-binding protein